MKIKTHLKQIPRHINVVSAMPPTSPIGNKKRQKGAILGMPEQIAVMVVGGIIALGAAAVYLDVFKIADASFVYDTADRLSQNWKLMTQKCNVSSEIGASPITSTPSAANALTLLVEGTGVNIQYQGCFQSVGLEPARNAGIKGTAGNYTARGYPVTLSNVVINNRNRVATTFQKVDAAVALEVVQQHGNQTGANTFATLPADDTTDPTVRFSANGTGYYDVTIIR